jgi:cell division septal protein FtsQ
VGLVFTVLALGAQWVVHSSYLRVEHVTLAGEVHESLARDLVVFPWVKSVQVVKHWPDSLTLRVNEVTPVAVAYDAHAQLRFVSAQGRDLGPAPLSANYPTLVYEHPRGLTWPFERAGRSAARVAAALPRPRSTRLRSTPRAR